MTTPAPATPVITRSEVTWRGAKLFESGPAGRTHLIDAAASQAPGPVETLLNAIVACTSVDVIDILTKRRSVVETYRVEIAGERRPEFPRRVRRLDIVFHVDGRALDRENTERAIQLAFERYCSVGASLAPEIGVHATLVLNGESGPPFRMKVWTEE
jgi:putative redox protein